MTVTALKMKSTPMGPYMELMQGMNRHDIQIVVTYLNEMLEKTNKPKASRKVPASFKKLRGMVNVTKEEMAQDARLAHIMER